MNYYWLKRKNGMNAYKLIIILSKFFVQGLHYAKTAIEHSDLNLQILLALAYTISTILEKYITIRKKNSNI